MNIIFDIETIPQDQKRLLALAPEFRANSNLKDPAKIKADIAEKRRRYLADAALDWKTAQIVLVGVQYIGGKYKANIAPEKVLIASTLDYIAESETFIGGHNVKGFDLPMLINRARVHGLKIPEGLMKGRYWSDKIFDTLEIISFFSSRNIEGNGVDAVAKAFGLPEKLGRGADFVALWKADRKKAISYNERDCLIECEIAQRCGF